MKDIQHYKDLIAKEYGCENWQELQHDFYLDVKGIDILTEAEDKAMKRYGEDLCKEQKIICINHTGFIKTTSDKLNSEEYAPFITDEHGQIWTIDKDKIITATLATDN